YTTVQTDVSEGLAAALKKLEQEIGPVRFDRRFACSSAAGGLKMMSCGLVPELTAEAARMAALGAGAKVMKVYSYQLTEEDGEEINRLNPDIFLLTGGTDGGNKNNILENARMLASLDAVFPVVIAGNRNAAGECRKILEAAEKPAVVCENVMPRFNVLNIEPAQTEIRKIFLERIIRAKGLSEAGQLISGILMPTPAAVLSAMELLSKGTETEKGFGELLAVDVGGATTDVYSMTAGDPTRAGTVLKGLPEPYAKRTVEGDIGMRYSAKGIAEAAGIPALARIAGLSEEKTETLLTLISEKTDILPETEELKALDFALAAMAVKTGVTRHAGRIEKVYTPVGETFVQEGKDLGAVSRVIATGGSLIHAGRTEEIVKYALYDPADPASLKPVSAEIISDEKYILSAMGLLARYAPETAIKIMKKELKSHGTAK
ncbi:MAG: methylaspartate mutase accessory protein GlmL, partial [Emergencia sp.]|nr:methylaspartate mutase accessory protein GlmL [Emergencia sp.]